MDRRAVLAGMGAFASTAAMAQTPGQAPAPADDIPKWSSPVIDMHFHMRRDPAMNIAHQVGAGVTAANVLARYDSLPAIQALQAQNAKMFPCWMASADISKPEAEGQLTAAIKSGARGVGELKTHFDADSPTMLRMYDFCAEAGVPVLIHFQEVTQAAAEGTYNAGITRMAPVIKSKSKTKFILHADAFWANVSADYDNKDPYPTGPVVAGGISDRLLGDYENVEGDLASNSANNFLSRDPMFTTAFLKRHQNKLHFGSDCNCEDGRGGGAGQNSDRVAARIRGKCVARLTLALLRDHSTPEVFHKLTWANAHRFVGIPA